MSTSENPNAAPACRISAADPELAPYEIIRAHLSMKHQIVGVRFIFDEAAAVGAGLPPRPERPQWYCRMVMDAAAGRHTTARIEDLSCPNSELALGFRRPKYVSLNTGFAELTRAIVIGPTDGADVALLILNGRQAMIMSILVGGISAEFRGETAVCGEATAQVYKEGIPNLSFLCNGARMFGGYKDSEVALGLTPLVASKAAERIVAQQKAGGALCGCVVADLPADIINSFKNIGFEKGTDYFFGKLGGHNVRIHPGKDEHGRIVRLTLHILEKAPLAGVAVMPPFETREFEGWIDISASFDTQSIGADLYSGGEKLRNTFAALIEKSLIKI